MNKTALLAWLAIAIPIAVLFGPALASDRSFALRDAGHFYYPLFEWCCREWAAGRVPLWNPLENCGTPALADTTSSVFYPGKLLFLLPVSFTLRYKLYVVSHVALSAGGSYVLARVWKASHPAAALAAMAFASGGGVVFQYSNVVFLVGAAWLPWAAFAADQMLRFSSVRAAAWLGVTLALMVLGGDPQSAYHVLLAAGIYAITRAIPRQTFKDEVPGEGRASESIIVRIGLVGLAAALGFLLSAIQILPSSEAAQWSERAAFNRPRNIYEATSVAFQSADTPQPLGETRWQSISRGLLAEPEERSHQEMAYDFSVGPWRLAEYIWPNISGRMFPTNRRWLSALPAEGRTWTPTLYLGLLPIALFASAFQLRRAESHTRWLSLLVLLFTLGSFGYYGVGWLIREICAALPQKNSAQLNIAAPVGGMYWLLVTLLPTYAYFRYPAKLLPLVSLGISQLATWGLDSAFSERRPRLARGLLLLGGVSGAAALAVWFIGPRLFTQIELNDSSLGPFDAIGAHRDVLLALIQTASVALVSCWLLTSAWNEPKRAAQWKLLAVLLTAIDISAANAWLVITAPTELWQNESPIAAAINSIQPDNASLPPRVFRGNLASWRPPEFGRTRSWNRPAELVAWEHATLFPKHELASGISLVESYGSIRLADYESLLFVAKQHGPRQPDKTLLPQPTALRLLGTQFLVLPQSHRVEFADRIAGEWPHSAALWQMERSLPRAWIVHDVHVLPPLTSRPRTEQIDERSKTVLFPDDKPRDFSRSAVVETADSLPEWQNRASDASLADETCLITRNEPSRVTIEAELAEPGLLVLSDACYPGWVATAQNDNGSSELPIYRANRVLRGVWLQAGKQTIEFRFQSQSFLRGAWISGLSWLLLFAGLTRWLIIGRRKDHPWHAS